MPGDGLPSLTPGSPPHVFLTVGDHLGSTALVVDLATSELVEQNGYQAYGGAESALRPGRWQSQREPYRFTGKEDDLEVGLQYFGARYYAPLLGRWLSPDPLAVHELGDDPNLYAYVHGRALVAVDPNGQFAWIPFLIGVGIALAINAGMQHHAIQQGNQAQFNWGAFAVAGVSAAAGGAVGAVAGPALGAAAGKLLGSAAWGVAIGTVGGGAVGGVTGGVTSRVGLGIAEGRAADEVLADAVAPGNLGRDAAWGVGGAVAGYAAGQAIGKVRDALRGGEAAVSGGSTSTAPGGAGPGGVAELKPSSTAVSSQGFTEGEARGRLLNLLEKRAAQVSASSDDAIDLYRAVGPKELQSIQSTGAFSSSPGLETKYFTTSSAHAADYAKQAVNAFGDPPYTIIQTRVSRSLLTPQMTVTVDRGIPSYVVPNDMLPLMQPQALPFSPIPISRF